MVMDKMKKMLLDEQGAIVVEATLSLSAFMFFIVVVLSIVNICYAQSKIGVAVNSTAKEISEYSYLYELTGLRGKQAELYEKSELAGSTIDNTLTGVTTIFDSASNISDNVSNFSIDNVNDSLSSISGSVDSGKEGIKSIQDSIETIADDPKTFGLSVLALIGNGVAEEAKSRIIAGPFSKLLCQKHLVNTDGGSYSDVKAKCNAFLKYLRVEPKGGSYLDGLDFSDSVLFLNGSPDIMVVVHYRIKVLNLLGNDITLSFTQCGTTRGWVPVSDKKDAAAEEEESEGESESEPEETEPKKTADDYLKEYVINPSEKSIMIGVSGGADIESANYVSASYMDIPSSDYDDIKENLGSSGVLQVHYKYVDDAINQRKTIYAASDPDKAVDPYFRKQVAHLKSMGYTFKYNEVMGVYIAEKS